MPSVAVLLPKIPPFGQLDFLTAQRLLPRHKEAAANRPFIEGDHFQRGAAWTGPGPKRSDPRYQEFLRVLKEVFIFKNVCDEGCDRLTGAVIGWEPYWAWVPRRHNTDQVPVSDAEKTRINEIESAQTNWWNTQKVHKKLKKLAYNSMWAKECCWRLYTPAGFLDADGNVSASTIEEAFSRVFLDIPEPEMATVWEHPDTKQKIGICVFVDSQGRRFVELTYLERDGEKKGQTTIRIVPATTGAPGANSSNGVSAEAATNDFGGHITMYMSSLDQPIINADVRSLQRAYNATLTLLQKGITDNHFLEKYFGNALPPGKYVYGDPAEPNKRTGYEVDIREVGGNIDTWLQGVDVLQPDGHTDLATPNVTFRNPIDPSTTIKGAEYWYQTLLEALRQDHILINQLATPSGKSREHSRGDFIDSTKDPVMETELAGRELMLTSACMAETFMGALGKWTKDFVPVFYCRPNYGPLSVAERNQNVVEAEKGFLSDETVMALNGTDDVDAEEALIDSQPRKQLDLISRRADVLAKLDLIYPRETALFMVGYTDKEIAEIMKRSDASNSVDPHSPDNPMNQPPAPTTGPANNTQTGIKTRADRSQRLRVVTGGRRKTA